jgi:hypothetical protein
MMTIEENDRRVEVDVILILLRGVFLSLEAPDWWSALLPSCK